MRHHRFEMIRDNAWRCEGGGRLRVPRRSGRQLPVRGVPPAPPLSRGKVGGDVSAAPLVASPAVAPAVPPGGDVGTRAPPESFVAGSAGLVALGAGIWLPPAVGALGDDGLVWASAVTEPSNPPIAAAAASRKIVAGIMFPFCFASFWLGNDEVAALFRPSRGRHGGALFILRAKICASVVTVVLRGGSIGRAWSRAVTRLRSKLMR